MSDDYKMRACASCGKRFRVYRWNAVKKYCSSECKPYRDSIPKWMYKKVLKRDKDTCRYCGNKAECIDHVVPVCEGGKTIESNLVASCIPCNQEAGGRVFNSFNQKKSYIMDGREKKKQVKVKQKKEPMWHAWVYGGMKRN